MHEDRGIFIYFGRIFKRARRVKRSLSKKVLLFNDYRLHLSCPLSRQ